MSVAAAFFSLADGSQQFQNHSFTMYLKNWDKFDPKNLKKTYLIFFCDIKWPQYTLEDGEHWPVEGSQILLFYYQTGSVENKRNGQKCHMGHFFSLQDMPDLYPKGADLGVKSSAASCSLTLPLYLGLPTEQTENQGTLPGGVASVLVEIQTVPTVVKTIRGFKKYIEAFWGLTLLYELT